MADSSTLSSDVQPLSYPKNEKGIGKLIQSPTSADLIDGVIAEPHPIWPDDRGYFLEVMRMGQAIASHFDLTICAEYLEARGQNVRRQAWQEINRGDHRMPALHPLQTLVSALDPIT